MTDANDPTGEIDISALARWMDDHDLPGDGELPALSIMSGGASNTILRVDRGEQSIILRRPPIEVANWLRKNQPKHYTPGIMHGDYQFANVMFRNGAPAELAAIIDWEMGTIGDPLLDLAWVIMGWPNADEDRVQKGYADYNGMPDREDLIEEWSNVSGLPADDLPYMLVLARFKMAAVLEPTYARFVHGKSTNPIHEYFGDIVLNQAATAAELAASLG